MTERLRRIAVVSVVTVVVAGLSLGCSAPKDGFSTGAASSAPTDSTPPVTEIAVESSSLEANAVVDRVIDGDTIIVVSAGEKERLRLIGIDTPESVHPSKPVQCFGKEASAYTSNLLPKGTPVHLKKDVEARDRYGRLLTYVYRSSDSLFVNMQLVLDGYADQYKYPPNDALSEQFAAAARQARDDGAGAWSACEPPFEK